MRIAHRLPGALVPQHHRAAAVLALGDRALELAVVERMVLDVHGEALVGRIGRGPLGDRPALAARRRARAGSRSAAASRRASARRSCSALALASPWPCLPDGSAVLVKSRFSLILVEQRLRLAAISSSPSCAAGAFWLRLLARPCAAGLRASARGLSRRRSCRLRGSSSAPPSGR